MRSTRCRRPGPGARTVDAFGEDGLTSAGVAAATTTITVAFVSADQGLVRVSDAFGVRRARTGSILTDDGTIYQVKWDDTGEEERVRRAADVHVATRGSLRFLALSDTRLFHAAFAQEPLAVVLHLLADSSVPLKVREIREHLIELGLRNETWARHGPRALAVLPKWPNVVRRQKGDTLAYAWVGDDLPDLPSDAESEPEPERATPAPASKPAPGSARQAAAPAEPAVPSAERLRRQMTAARSLSEVARLLTLPREFVATLSPEVVASALRRVAAEDRLVMGWLDALTASGPIGALTEELATARAANAALQSRVDELEEWWTALEQSTDPGAAIRQPDS
ncbi:hypothetical protein [Actinoplanes sp. NPDC049265]|uniref:hypothetical protein n=1 Tax=Actinoplanes sp. NPDC049265 TaxID=3363902 RepID=UPI003721C360